MGLEPLAPEGFRLLGWRQWREDEIDEGVGDELASLLARALTRVALVTFSRSSDPRASTAGGSPGRRVSSGTGGSEQCFRSTPTTESASQGTWPASIWYAMMPTEYWSTACVSGWPRISSPDM